MAARQLGTSVEQVGEVSEISEMAKLVDEAHSEMHCVCFVVTDTSPKVVEVQL